MRRAPFARAWLLAALVAWAPAASVRADPSPEPPIDAAAGVDYAAAPDDSIDAGSVSVGYGLSGRAGGPPGRTRSLRVRGDSVEAGLREGDGDPYAGGDLSSRGRGRVLRIGRIAPTWGRGLVVGSPADPWVARDAGGTDPFAARARGGDGASCVWSRAGLEAFAGRVDGRSAAGAAVAARGARLGLAAAHGRPAGASLSFARDDRSLECALDALGSWRAEAAARHAGPVEAALRAGIGDERFAAPLAPARAVPARTVAASLGGGAGALRVRTTLAAWRYAAGASGARAGTELAWGDARRGAWVWGFEEQHGVRRAPTTVAARPAGMRQGAWVDWRGEAAGLALGVRDEWWGRRAFARDRVRETLGAALEAPLPAGARLELAHTVYRARTGETVYLPERDSDRWVLRALGGVGQRTRATLRLPLAEGVLGGTVTLTTARGTARTQWSLQWSRRVRLRRGR